MEKNKKWINKEGHKLSHFLMAVFVIMVIIISVILINWYQSYKFMKSNNQQLIVEVLEQNRNLVEMHQIVFQLIHETEICLITNHERNCEALEIGENRLNELVDNLMGLHLSEDEIVLLETLQTLYYTYYKTVYNEIDSAFSMSSQEQSELNAIGHQMIDTINQILDYSYILAEELSESSKAHSESTASLFYMTILLMILIVFIFIKYILKPSYNMEQVMLKEANLDYLTKLFNRNGFMKVMQSKFKSDKDFKGALLMMDLDGFKQVNDSLGHDAGDLMLKEIAKLIVNCLRKQDVIMRLGGDEFVLFIDQEDDQAEIEKLCDRLLESISNLRCFENSELTVTASIGGCVMNMDFRDLDLAIKKADDALYTAKENGKNRYVLC